MAPPTMTETELLPARPYVAFSQTESKPTEQVEVPAAEALKAELANNESIKSEDRTLEFSIGIMATPPVFENKYKEREYLKSRLALAFRVFAKHGFDQGVAGHITLRDPVDPTSFWLNPFGRPWPILEAKDLIRVDAEGNIVEHGAYKALNKAAYMIHHAVHTLRPDVHCVAHAHSTYGKAFSTLGKNIDILTQDACAFWNDVAHYESFGGAVLGPEEGQRIAQALGHRKAAILANHGLLTCGQTIEACTWWFTSLENCCQVQLLADAAAAGTGSKTVKVDDEEAEYTWKIAGRDTSGYISAMPMFDLVEAASRGYCF